MDIAAALREHECLKSDRQRYAEGQWRELARLFAPDDQDFSAQDDTSADWSEIFDATHLYAQDEFNGGMFSQLVNPANRWMELGIQDPELQEWGPVKDYLFQSTNILFASMAPAVSNFYTAATSWIGDVGLYGLGNFYQEELVGQQRIIDLAIPVGQTFFDLTVDGEINRVHREFKVTGRQMKQKWQGAPGVEKARDASTYAIIHCVWPNPDYRQGAFGPAAKAWLSSYVSPDIREFFTQGGYHELPYHLPMWRRRSGRTYPTGPGHRSMPDVSTLQEMERSHLVAAQFAAEPPTLTNEDSLITAADIVPNAVLNGALSESGKRLADTLDRSQNVNLSYEQAKARRESIRSAWYYGIMQLVQRPQMTATEFLGFQEENLRQMGPNLVRLQTGGLSPFIKRRHGILSRAGQFPPPPRELAGKRIEIEYVSPLAKALQATRGREAMQVLQGIQAGMAVDPSTADNFDGDVYARTIGQAYSAVPGLIRDKASLAQLRQAKAAQAAQQLQLQQTGEAVSIAAEAAHAQQAQSSAKARTR